MNGNTYEIYKKAKNKNRISHAIYYQELTIPKHIKRNER